jgi:hypothetical protein
MVSIVNSGVMHVLTRYVNHVKGIIHMVVYKAIKEFVVNYQVY